MWFHPHFNSIVIWFFTHFSCKGNFTLNPAPFVWSKVIPIATWLPCWHDCGYKFFQSVQLVLPCNNGIISPFKEYNQKRLWFTNILSFMLVCIYNDRKLHTTFMLAVNIPSCDPLESNCRKIWSISSGDDAISHVLLRARAKTLTVCNIWRDAYRHSKEIPFFVSF